MSFTMNFFSIFNNEYKNKFVYCHGMKVKDSYMSSKFFFLFDQYKCGDRFESMYVFIWCMPPWYMVVILVIRLMQYFSSRYAEKPRAKILSQLLCTMKQQKKSTTQFSKSNCPQNFVKSCYTFRFAYYHSFHQGITLVSPMKNDYLYTTV